MQDWIKANILYLHPKYKHISRFGEDIGTDLGDQFSSVIEPFKKSNEYGHFGLFCNNFGQTRIFDISYLTVPVSIHVFHAISMLRLYRR